MRSALFRLVRTPLRAAVAGVVLLVGVVGTAYGSVTLAGESGFTSALVAAHSDKCVEAPIGARRAAQLRQRACTEADPQRFEFTLVDRAAYTLRSVATGYCVEVRRARQEDGAPVSPNADCHGGANQRFTLRPVAAGYQLVAVHSGKCLDVYAGSQDAGAPLVQWACGDPATAGNQVWKVTAADVPPAPPTASPTGGPAPTGGATPTAGATPSPATTTTGPAAEPGPGGTNPAWGKELPPAGAPVSRAYALIQAARDKGYQPKEGECSVEAHARYWTWGPDGKVYPTWHPARDPSGCSFGHEHGDDPRTSVLFERTGWDPYGYTNELLAPSNPASQRNEDHVGHKQAVGNGITTRVGNNPRGRIDMNCDALLKFHQGTHSPDALTSNLHELFYNVRCKYTDNGAVTDTNFRVLLPIGHPGSFNVNNNCDGSGTTVHNNVGPADPPNSPDGGFSSRRIPDHNCAQSLLSGNGTIGSRFDELWQLELHVRNAGQLRRFDFNPYMIVKNPSRFFDPAQPNKISRTIDLCYQGARGAECDRVRQLTSQTGARIAFDDPRSPFNGAVRHFDPNRFVVQNDGPTTLYTDVFGRRFSTTPFTGSIQQFISGNHAEDGSQGDIFMPTRNYAATAADGIHAPN